VVEKADMVGGGGWEDVMTGTTLSLRVTLPPFAKSRSWRNQDEIEEDEIECSALEDTTKDTRLRSPKRCCTVDSQEVLDSSNSIQCGVESDCSKSQIC